MTDFVNGDAESTSATVAPPGPPTLIKPAQPQAETPLLVGATPDAEAMPNAETPPPAQTTPIVPTAPAQLPVVIALQPHTTPIADGLAMKRRNPWAVWLGLPIITLGIYFFVWYYKIHKEMAEFDRRRSIPVAGPVLVVIFLGWTVIAPWISYHNAGARIRASQRSSGLQQSCSPAWSWLLAIAVGLNVFYMQVELNKIVDRYAGAPAGTQVPLYV